MLHIKRPAFLWQIFELLKATHFDIRWLKNFKCIILTLENRSQSVVEHSTDHAGNTFTLLHVGLSPACQRVRWNK